MLYNFNVLIIFIILEIFYNLFAQMFKINVSSFHWIIFLICTSFALKKSIYHDFFKHLLRYISYPRKIDFLEGHKLNLAQVRNA